MSYEETSKFCGYCNRQVLARRQGTNHILHLLLTLVTFGFWLIIWILCSVKIGGWKCSICGQPVTDNSPNGSVRYKTSTVAIVLIVLCFAFIGVIRAFKDTPQKVSAKTNHTQRLSPLTPEQRAEAEKKNQEQERANQEAERRRLGLKWNYQESNDEMGRGKIKQASVNSVKPFEFGFPYNGLQRATLSLREHPAYGKNVMFLVERGQFLYDSDRPYIQIRFGDGKPEIYKVSEPSDHSTNILFIDFYNKFIENMKKVDRVYIEAQFYQEGNRVFEFDVSGFNVEFEKDKEKIQSIQTESPVDGEFRQARADIEKPVVEGIVYSKENPCAVVGDRIVSVGDVISGATIVKINPSSVEFEMDGKKWTQIVNR